MRSDKYFYSIQNSLWLAYDKLEDVAVQVITLRPGIALEVDAWQFDRILSSTKQGLEKFATSPDWTEREILEIGIPEFYKARKTVTLNAYRFDHMAQMWGDIRSDLELFSRYQTIEAVAKGNSEQQIRRMAVTLANRIDDLRYALLIAIREILEAVRLTGGTPVRDIEAEYRPIVEGKAQQVVSVYLDTNDDSAQRRAIAAVEHLARNLGYELHGQPITERGSIFKRWSARIKVALTSQEVQQRLAKVEEYADSYLNERVSDNNIKGAQAFGEVVSALTDIPHAVINVGTLLVVKRTGPQGPVIVARNLSAIEMRLLERYPEIQKDPTTALDMLAHALAFKEDGLALLPPDTAS